MDNDDEARIAYDASLHAIQDQANVLDGLRSRAGTVLAAAALVSSFLGGQALQDVSHLRLWSFAGAALGSFVASAFLTLAILWPIDLRFSISARATLDASAKREAKMPVTAAELYRVIALQLEWRYDLNRRKIQRLLWGFELAIVFLIIEVAAWIVVLWRT